MLRFALVVSVARVPIADLNDMASSVFCRTLTGSSSEQEARAIALNAININGVFFIVWCVFFKILAFRTIEREDRF